MDSEVKKGCSFPTASQWMKTIWASIRLLLLGLLVLWIITPTSIYNRVWFPNIRAKTNSTYFGRQGTLILIYTVPVLLLAVLGCVYLHLEKKYGDNSIGSNGQTKLIRLAFLRARPMLVDGPLGIVTWTELAFFTMFIALLVWSYAVYLQVGLDYITSEIAEAKGEKLWQAQLDCAAVRLGVVGNVCLAFLFFPVTRGSSVLPLLGLTWEASIKYHIWVGHAAMILLTAHGLCYFVYWAATHQISQVIKWAKAGISNMAGELSLLSGLAMWMTSFPCIRRKKFELFFYTHQLYFLFLVFFVLHVGSVYSYVMLPGLYLFLVDRYLRFLQSRQHVKLVCARLLPCETIELNFSKSPGLTYAPTSIVFLNVPSISKLQWHPFTISSSSNMDPEKLSIIIGSEGSWSQRLYQMLSSPSPVDHLEVSIEGPYGPASTHFLRHDTIVMVSGGSGITPFISIIQEILSRSITSREKSPRVILIAVFKRSADLTMLELLLPVQGISSSFSYMQLQINAFVTKEKEPATKNQKLLETIWFKPHKEDTPLYPILGQNNWLWLGIIISSSFVIFLILLGILMHYYIYPIDHNTEKIYSHPLRALLNTLFLCICIAMTASAVVLWNKKQNAMEAKEIQNNDASMPMASLGPASHNVADCELETLPRQSLLQATKVYYGERPNLKKMLSECEGLSIGVLVCGPKKMRHDVAKICSSNPVGKLHFESISFNW
ncbi:PREDICTED: probable ferric reduction oxidase 1 [Nelumbo nucifera]|uniref:ferric-chelate reductase (NADH) n=2 Tax=Nelumbo nucifera TaxID=4432 RepID=A0A822Z0F7_NELNU|nr:PREDICTED: probable ferric reduction oxidase 1 [Nelumbo nucifera]DAD39854.1 TPA_asm: hypothetical protein HUJ06_014177 [Nelumbo nucifera]